MNDPKVKFSQVFKMCGGNIAEIAKKLDVSRVSVYNWRKNGGNLPTLFAYRWLWNYGLPGKKPLKQIKQ